MRNKEDLYDLLQRLAAGDHSAFEIIYNRYAPLADRFLSMLGYTDCHQKEDIIQDIFLVIWNKREKWITLNSFDNYLFVMARNRFLTEKRKSSRFRGANRYAKSLEDLSDNSTTETINFREIERICNMGINNLSPRMREAFLLSEERGFKAREIAGLMGISLFTAKKHRMDALSILREWLKDHVN